MGLDYVRYDLGTSHRRFRAGRCLDRRTPLGDRRTVPVHGLDGAGRSGSPDPGAPPAGFFWLLLGGILYSVGGVLYAVKWPGRNNPRFGCHEIFHVFILLGSICHFILMYQVIAYL